MPDLLSALKNAGLVSNDKALAVEKEKRNSAARKAQDSVDTLVNKRPIGATHGKEPSEESVLPDRS